jgi:hypothetical protein
MLQTSSLLPIFFLSKILAGLEERGKSKKISSRSSVRVNGVRRTFLE